MKLNEQTRSVIWTNIIDELKAAGVMYEQRKGIADRITDALLKTEFYVPIVEDG